MRRLRWLVGVPTLKLFGVLRHTLVAVAVFAGSTPLLSQPVAGVGDDAVPLPKGAYRFLIGGHWNDYRSRYGVSTETGTSRRDLLGTLATDQLGVAQLPQLSEAQAGIRALSGNANFVLSLGTLEAAGEVHQSIAPFTLDYGVTKRLSLRVVVPYVESRDVSQLILNRAGTGANVGRNPTYGTSGAQIRAANGALLTQIDAARTALSTEITRCANPVATGCDAIRANPAGAEALLTRAQNTRSSLGTVYGDATRGGAPVVPTNGSAVHASVVSTISALRTDFGAYGIATIGESAQPAPATTVLGPAGFSAIGTDSSFGVGYQQLGGTRRAGIGDIDLTATVLLHDSFGADQIRRLLSPTRGWRSTLTMGWRFGTAGADRTEDAFDVPIGEGANAVLVRSTTDLIINRWAWISGTVRAVHPIADRIAIVLPYRDEAGTFSAPVLTGSAARTLGSRLDVEVAPRMSIGQFFGVSGALLVRRWGRDQYNAGNEEISAPNMSTMEVPTRTMRAAAFGLSFSTLASYARGRSRFPAEVVYTHTRPLGASGGTVPAMSTDRLELRIYKGFPRR